MEFPMNTSMPVSPTHVGMDQRLLESRGLIES